ncbi:MAG: carbon storage regulator CsrA [Pseudomonadota bacterium]|nr:carbon storage regulator CsrA [Pseudomonadota bacterium]
MLILTRRLGEAVNIGGEIKVTLLEIKGNSARIGVEAPRRVAVHRSEIFEMIQEQNRQAAASELSLADIMGKMQKEREK